MTDIADHSMPLLDEEPVSPSMTNPANRLPPEYDDLAPVDYDPAFTADISSRMRVPDSIAAFKGNQDDIHPSESYENLVYNPNANMMVPDRILVAGQDQHIGMREELNLKLDRIKDAAMSNKQEFVGLTTPPRVLTLEERPFPSAYEEYELHQPSSPSAQLNGFITPKKSSGYGADLLATPGDGLLIQDGDMDDITVLKRQVGKLTRHVIQLEAESASRKTRELVLYPVVLGYILVQVARWFLRNN